MREIVESQRMGSHVDHVWEVGSLGFYLSITLLLFTLAGVDEKIAVSRPCALCDFTGLPTSRLSTGPEDVSEATPTSCQAVRGRD